MAKEDTPVAVLQRRVAALEQTLKTLIAWIGVSQQALDAPDHSDTTLLSELSDLRDIDSATHGLLADISSRVEEVETLVKGRNKSAPVKRNMTDEDAVRCATGDAKALDHREAAELISLTYAQVYSFRLGYTFKHVHKQLRDAGWKNPWEKNTAGVHRIEK